MNLPKNIKHLRKLNKISQTELGHKLNVSHAQIGAYERGESDPPLSKLVSLCELFGVTLDNLVFDDLRIAASAPASSAEEKRIIAVLNEVARKTPYPVSVFPDCEWPEVGKVLNENGINSDRIFAKFGRMVWENCIAKIKSHFFE